MEKQQPNGSSFWEKMTAGIACPPTRFPGTAAVRAPVHHAPNSEINTEEWKAGRVPAADNSNVVMYC